MFGKLMKYELKDSMRIFLPLWGAVLAIALINGFTLGMGPVSSSPLVEFLVHILPLLLLVVLSIGMFAVALVLIIRRFYNGLLGEGGVLAFTLPVTHAQHIGAKLLTALIMEAGCCLTGALASLLMVLIRGYGDELGEFLPRIMKFFPSVHNASLLIVELVVLFVLWSAFIILRLYSGMAVGHLFGSHRGLWSVLGVIGIGWVFRFITLGIVRIVGMLSDSNGFHITIDSSAEFLRVMPPVLGFGILLLLLACAAMWAVTQIILQKKLNIL